MSFNWRRPFSRRDTADEADPNTLDRSSPNEGAVSDGSLKYTLEKGGNNSKASYQEVSGAPVERESPLGYQVGKFTIIFLNIGTMIGTGVYSTRMFNIYYKSQGADLLWASC